MTDRDPIRDLWTNQPREDFAMSIDDIRTRASKLQSVVQRRNAVEYAAGAFVVLAFGAIAFVVPGVLSKIGCGLIAAGAAYVMWRLHVLARAASRDEMSAAESLSRFYRHELARQRDALSSIWRWYLGPLVPGLVVFWLATVVNVPTRPAAWVTAALGLAVSAAVFVGIAALNKRAAKKLQAEIEALDAAGAEPK
jgi:hypothetical protein